MKPSPGIIPQQTIIENLHASDPANPPVIASASVVDRGQVASVQAIEKSILQKVIDALKGVK